MSFEDMNFWRKRAVIARMRGHHELASPIMDSYNTSPIEDLHVEKNSIKRKTKKQILSELIEWPSREELQKMVFENYPSTYPSMKGDNREYYCVFI